MKDQHQEQNRKQNQPHELSSLLSRRDLLRYAGCGAIALSQLELLASAQAQRRGGRPPHLLAGPGSGTLQLPFWSDAGWSQPEYYETIQAGRRSQPRTVQYADVNHDGQDELLARGPKGLLVNVYDPTTGQWLPMAVPLGPDGSPIFSDANDWNHPQYYQTIQTADVNHDRIQELLARSAGGIILWGYNAIPDTPTYGQWVPLQDGPAWSDNNGWDQPQYYETIQCADIDGNGPYLIGRAPDTDPHGKGIQVWRYQGNTSDPTNQSWTPQPSGPPWTDAAGWNLPQYYETIQCADVVGNPGGIHKALLGQGPNGMEMWAFDWRHDSPTHNTWVKGANVWDASGNFTQPQYYRTIQLADIDGDRAQELIVRGPYGIRAWKFQGGSIFDPADQTWIPLPDGPAWSDHPINGKGGGWYQAQYYETIQCADIDGDGQAELLARDASGIEVWKFVPGQHYPPDGQWIPMSRGPAWSDAAGWNWVERYSTIQTAMVNLPDPDASRPRHVLLGRGPLGLQTWYYNLNTKTWQQTSASYPAFTSSQQSAYTQLDTALRFGEANGNIRSVYNDETADFTDWMQRMYATPPADYNMPPAQRPQTILPLPAGVAPTDWNAVVWQIYWEMSYVGTPGSCINDYYGNKVNGLIKTAFQGKGFTLPTVGGVLGLPADSSATVALSIFALLAEAAGAIAGFPEISEATAGAVSNLLGVAFSAAAEFLPNGGGGFQQAYSQLQETLSNSFGQTLTANANNQFAITGGTSTDGSYVPGDWGLMSVIGPFIQRGAWDWPGSINGMVSVLQRRYGVTISQALLPVIPWIIWTNFTFNGPAYNFPSQYLFYSTGSDGSKQVSWISESKAFGTEVPATSSLSMIFDAAIPDQWEPLGTPLADVYIGEYGWPLLSGNLSIGASRQPRRVVPGVDLRMVADFTRDSLTGEIVVAITLLNRGLTAATNVEITDARLRGKHPLSALPTRDTRLATGHTCTEYLRFPNLTAGQRAVVRLSGRYLGGTFGASLRLTVP
jgi:hypothetical protein